MEIPSEVVEAKRLVEFDILALPGVVGVGLGMREEDGELFDELAAVVYVEDATQVPEGLPQEIGGVGVCVVERSVEPFGFPDTARYSDVRGGIAILRPSMRAPGTLGAVVVDTQSSERFGLTCYHVVGDPPELPGDSFPDSVWQPNNPPLTHSPPPPKTDNLGEVARVTFPQDHPLPDSPVVVGLVDAALVQLDVAANFGQRLPSPAIADQGIGQPNLVDSVTDISDLNFSLPHPVRKRGQVTGPTHGRLVTRFLTLSWPDGGKNAYIMEQGMVEGDDIFGQPGDSGALVLDETSPTALGVLWGGNPPEAKSPRGKFCYFSEILNVQAQLGFSTVWP
ncbi:hypothetical protein AB0L59_35710 [Streptomyces sp. NPDC052109]|uniref:hypothetical protein n=1 Tax=Streptomyces sp. NPDC052109 TaxID=3155527 RepID=UPI00341AF89C